MQHEQQERALEALAIACQHSAFISVPAVLCVTACICTDLRQVVQQHCSGCHVAVTLPFSTSTEQLCSFSSWLPKHGRLLKSISVMAPGLPPEDVNGLQWQQCLKAGLQLQQQAKAGLQVLQQAVQLTAVSPGSAAAAAGVAPSQQQQQGLRLESFSSYWQGAPELLAALPAHSLTQLHLDLGWPGPISEQGRYSLNGSVAAAAVARLSNLQQLRLSNTGNGCSNPASCVAFIAQLSQLTLLDLEQCDDYQWAHDDDADVSDDEAGELPAQMPVLQALLPSLSQLRVLHLPRCSTAFAPWPALSFTHMTQLEVLTNYSPDVNEDVGLPFTEVQLPAQLKHLGLGALREEQLDAVVQLQQLQGLTLFYRLGDYSAVSEAVQQLQFLTKLSALQRLSLSYDNASMAARSAASWAQLPQLCELRLDFDDNASKQRWQAIIGGLAAATSLTKLELLAQSGRHIRAGYVRVPVAACDALAGLTRLLNLCFRPKSRLNLGDARALSTLTALTRLVLKGVGSGVGDEAAAAIARSCRQLRELDLRDCRLGSAACLADIAQLTQLTQLLLEDNGAGITAHGLMQLTGLQQLQRLGVSRVGEVTDEVVRDFWAAVRGGH